MSKNKNNGMKMVKVICFIGAFIILLELTIMGTYYIFHPTHYKYNDVWIKGKTIEEIEKRYGESEKLLSYNGYSYGDNYIGYQVYSLATDIFGDLAGEWYYSIYIGDDGRAEKVGVYECNNRENPLYLDIDD